MLRKHVNDLFGHPQTRGRQAQGRAAEHRRRRAGGFIASHFDILAAERGVRLEVQAPASLVAAVDPETLQRVVMNLLSNAFKLVPPAGEVRVHVATRGDRLTVSVDDSGPGVRPELRKALFERSRQGEGGTNRQTSGIGLGLAVADEFIELHKGTVDVLDSDRGGARFEVSLPLVGALATVLAAPESNTAC